MGGTYRLKRSFQNFDKNVKKEQRQYPGDLGVLKGGQYQVEVPGRPGFYYVRLRSDLSELVIAQNDGVVAPFYDLPVLVARDPENMTRWIITGRDASRYGSWGSTNYMANHGPQHSFDPSAPGHDIAWVWGDQFVPMNAVPSGTNGSLNLIIEPSYYYINKERKWIGLTGTQDLTPYLPTSGSSKFVLIYGDRYGNPAVVAGPAFTSSISGTFELEQYIPQISGTYGSPIRAVRLEYNTTRISWAMTKDARPLFAWGSSDDATYTPTIIPYAGANGSLTQHLLFNFRRVANDFSQPNMTIGSPAGQLSNYEDYNLVLVDDYGGYDTHGSGSQNKPLATFTFGDTPNHDYWYANGRADNPTAVTINDVVHRSRFMVRTTSTTWRNAGYWQVKALENLDAEAWGIGMEFYLTTTGTYDQLKALDLGATYAKFNGLVQIPNTDGYYWGTFNAANSWRYKASGTSLDLEQYQSGAWRSYIHTTPSGTAIGDVYGGNTLEVHEDGFVTLNGSATYWDDVLPYAVNPGTGLTALGSKQYGTTGFNMYFWSNNPSADETYQASFQIPHKYKSGTNGRLHVHLIPSQNGSGGNDTVVMVAKYQWVNIGGAYSTSTNSVVSGTFIVGATEGDDHVLWSLPELDGAGKGRSSDLMVQIVRLSKTAAADNYTGDLYLRFIDVHVECDRLGTNNES